MPKVAPKTHQDTLDTLRRIRKQLFSIPEAELSALSLEDQIRYGDSLFQTTSAISKLELLKLKNINAKFKAEEQNLNSAAAKLETDLNSLTFITEVVRAVSAGIGLITKIIALA
jgi:hypothetical protein